MAPWVPRLPQPSPLHNQGGTQSLWGKRLRLLKVPHPQSEYKGKEKVYRKEFVLSRNAYSWVCQLGGYRNCRGTGCLLAVR